MYLSVNLLGLFVRGLFSNPELDRLKSEGREFIKNEIEKSQRADKWINIIVLILIIAYLYLLFHFWNIGVMAVAIMLMIGRFDSLLWEIKNGKKTNTKLMPKNALFYICSFFIWGALPALYYFLYHF
jgi:hypothetical protein